MGSIVFSRIELAADNATPIFHFRKKTRDAKYSPLDAEQPLRYLMRFLLRMQISKNKVGWGIFSFLRNLFKSDKHLELSVTEFTKGCKKQDGFEIIQGSQLLD